MWSDRETVARQGRAGSFLALLRTLVTPSHRASSPPRFSAGEKMLDGTELDKARKDVRNAARSAWLYLPSDIPRFGHGEKVMARSTTASESSQGRRTGD